MPRSDYRLPRPSIRKLVWSALAGRTRSFAEDAGAVVQALPRRPLILGAEHIPSEGACLVTCNHYTQPGLGVWWTALSISAAIAERRGPHASADVHWVMTAAWRYPEGNWRRRTVTPLTRWAFARAAGVYDFITMPPLDSEGAVTLPPEDVEARAVAVLRTVRLARRLVDEGGMLGLAPEGRDTPGLLGEPPPGAGAFVALLVAAGLPVLPVGVAEEGDRLRVSFGAPFVPEIPRRRGVRDRAVIDQVMSAIAAQLPL
ncbi:MAG: lysophospholipid acyltransferase family protein [Anaerolineae bacterium]